MMMTGDWFSLDHDSWYDNESDAVRLAYVGEQQVTLNSEDKAKIFLCMSALSLAGLHNKEAQVIAVDTVYKLLLLDLKNQQALANLGQISAAKLKDYTVRLAAIRAQRPQ